MVVKVYSVVLVLARTPSTTVPTLLSDNGILRFASTCHVSSARNCDYTPPNTIKRLLLLAFVNISCAIGRCNLQTAMAFRVIQNALSVVVTQLRTLASLASEVDRLHFLLVSVEKISDDVSGHYSTDVLPQNDMYYTATRHDAGLT